jgi:phospholipid transport system substrate-binding protein
MLRVFFLALCLSLGLNLPAVSADVPPDVLARTTSQEVLAVLKADKDIQRGDLSKIYELVEAKVLPNFDFNRMTQLAMGRHWPKASAQQKQVLVAEFRNLLVRTYATSLTEFGGQSVEFKNFSMKPEDTEVVVRSEIRQPGGQPISIDYSMYKTAFGWKVYDVTIDSVSLVTNYRATFANTIRQSGIDGLIKTLSAQSAKGASQPASAKPAARSGS